MYATEHEISLQMEGLDKPRKKRGRPPKIEKLENEEDEKVKHNLISEHYYSISYVLFCK